MRKEHLIFIRTNSFVKSFWLSSEMPEPELFEPITYTPRCQTPENQHTRGPCLSLQILHSTSHYIPKPGGGLEDTLTLACCCSTWGRTLAAVLAGQQAIQSRLQNPLAHKPHELLVAFVQLGRDHLPLLQSSASNARSACSMSSCERGSPWGHSALPCLPAPHGISCRDA